MLHLGSPVLRPWMTEASFAISSLCQTPALLQCSLSSFYCPFYCRRETSLEFSQWAQSTGFKCEHSRGSLDLLFYGSLCLKKNLYSQKLLPHKENAVVILSLGILNICVKINVNSHTPLGYWPLLWKYYGILFG